MKSAFCPHCKQLLPEVGDFEYGSYVSVFDQKGRFVLPYQQMWRFSNWICYLTLNSGNELLIGNAPELGSHEAKICRVTRRVLLPWHWRAALSWQYRTEIKITSGPGGLSAVEWNGQ